MTTEPRMKGETAAERALRFAQMRFDQRREKDGRKRPGSLKKHGRISPARKGKSGRTPWFRRVGAPRGWEEEA